MSFLGKKSLGIALGSRSLQVAEIHASGSGCRFVRAAEMTFGEKDSLQDAASLGKKLGQFLKENDFTARETVVGIPAQWLMIKEKTLPPAPLEAINSILMIQAERDFSLEPSALAVDYVLGQSSAEGHATILVAALRERIDQIRALAAAAGLKLQSVTSTSLALYAASQHPNVFYFGLNGAELVTRGSSKLPRLRYVSSSTVMRSTSGQPAAMQMAGEIRRGAALSQRDSDGSEMLVWDDAGIDEGVIKELSTELSVPVKLGENFKAGLNGFAKENAAGSAALAFCYFQPALKTIDFLHSRLEIKPPSRINSRVIWGAVAGIVLLLGFGYLLMEWQQSAAEVADLRDKRDEMKENVESAKGFISQVNATRTWYERRPNYLECLRAITLTFPEEGRVWTSSVSLREDMRGILSGRATDEKHVLDVLDKIKSSKSFSDVKMLHMRGSGTKSSEISFGISFVFVGAE